MNSRHKLFLGRILTCFLLLYSFPLRVYSHSSGFSENLVQPAVLEAPTRGSLAGEMSSLDVKASDLTQGSYSLPLGISFAEERGPLLVSLTPTYSITHGISEWGMGVRIPLCLSRFRVVGEIDFKEDDLMSPWGRLIRGKDGDYYPLGMSSKLRVRKVSDIEWKAFLEDGVVLTFGRDTYLRTPAGVYSWYLVEAKNPENRYSFYQYEQVDSWFYLKDVRYGGSEKHSHYQLTFDYEPAYPTGKSAYRDYRSGIGQTLSRRVFQVHQLVDLGGRFSERFKYSFSYEDPVNGTAFYLRSIQKTYFSGGIEPAQRLTYFSIAEFIKRTGWKDTPKLDPWIEKLGRGILQGSGGSQLDIERNGLASIEIPQLDYAVLKQTKDKFELENIAAWTADMDPDCRRKNFDRAVSRRLLRIRGLHSPLEVVLTQFLVGEGQTLLKTCSREGMLTGKIKIRGNWELNHLTRLVDLNRDGRPDFIKVHGGQFAILENRSTEHDLAFSEKVVRGDLQIRNRVADTPRAIYVQDLNGDGIPDIVAQYSAGFAVWYGKGNLQFETHGRGLEVINSRNTNVHFSEGLNVVFQDLDGDGSADLIIFGRNHLSVFLNQGGKFVQQSLTALQSFPFDMTSLPSVVPALGDFLGSGNLQMTVASRQKAAVIELNSPDTGFLKSYDDGKGNVVWFTYGRSEPEIDLGGRPSVLQTIDVDTTGQDHKIQHFHYSKAQIHSLTGAFIGFDHVEVDQGTHRISAQFVHNDTTPTLLSSIEEVDQRQPDLFRFKRLEYEQMEFEGIPFHRTIRQSEGWTNSSKSVQLSSDKNFLHYEYHFCPSQTVEATGPNNLHVFTGYQKPHLLAAHLGCYPTSIQLTGTHVYGSDWDFSYGLTIQRDDLGHPLQLSTLGAEGRILQNIQYNRDFQPEWIHEPGKGTTVFDYDSSQRLVAIHAPDETVVQVDEFHPLLDRATSLSTKRGSGVQYSQGFQYDAFERLSQQWNNLYVSSQADPLRSFTYQYASNGRPAWVQEVERLAFSFAGSSRIQTILQSGSGKDLARAEWINGNWTLRDIHWWNPQLQSQESFLPQVVSTPPQEMSVESLLGSATKEGSQVASFLGYNVSRSSLFQADVRGLIETQVQLDQNYLQYHHLENGFYSSKEKHDALGRIIEKEDESGHFYRFQVDALGRVVQVVLPDGQTQKVFFDSQGRVREILRSDLGSVELNYYPENGLCKSKTYLSLNGSRLFEVDWYYDQKGRKTYERWTAFEQNGKVKFFGAEGAAKSWEYIFWYDGQTPHGFLSGQTGFLSAVQGPRFTKIMQYRPDGKIREVELQIPSWKNFIQTIEYQSDGALYSQTIQTKEDPSSKITQEWIPNSFGKLGGFRLNGKNVFNVSTSFTGQVESVQYELGATYSSFQYDSLTQRLQGVSRKIGDQDFHNFWNYDNRGLIAGESLRFGKQAINRNYSYYPHRLLMADTDETGNRAYQYDSTGSLFRWDDSGQATQVTFPAESWKVSQGEKSQAYQLDGFGRVKKVLNQDRIKELTYGPHGRVVKVAEYKNLSSLESREESIVEYSYDENGKRLTKERGGKVLELYWDQMVLTEQTVFQPVRINGILLGVLENQKFFETPADLRGSVAENGASHLNIHSPYGEKRERNQNPHSFLVEYVAQGYDTDLGAYRMDHRDYDPIVKRFHTPDLYFLENAEKCVESPIECGLYSYAKSNPVSFVDPTGKSGENIHELFSKEAYGLNSIANGFEGWKDAAVKTFDSFVGNAYKTIGEFTGVNSAVRVVGGIEPWSITASNPGQIISLTLSERVTEGVQTLAFAGIGHGLGALKESTLGIQMVDIVGFKTFTDTQLVRGLENLNTSASTLSTVNAVFDGINQESTLLK